MNKKLANAKIVKIEKIQNFQMYHYYEENKEIMSQKYLQSVGVEMYLFHGTSENDPNSIIKSGVGLGINFAKFGLFGRGIYIGDDACYS